MRDDLEDYKDAAIRLCEIRGIEPEFSRHAWEMKNWMLAARELRDHHERCEAFRQTDTKVRS